MKNKATKLTVALSMTVMMSMGSAIAGSKAIEHSVADFNGDGMVTSEELVTYVQMNFLKMDKNNDRMLNAKEWNDIFDVDG